MKRLTKVSLIIGRFGVGLGAAAQARRDGKRGERTRQKTKVMKKSRRVSTRAVARPAVTRTRSRRHATVVSHRSHRAGEYAARRSRRHRVNEVRRVRVAASQPVARHRPPRVRHRTARFIGPRAPVASTSFAYHAVAPSRGAVRMSFVGRQYHRDGGRYWVRRAGSYHRVMPPRGLVIRWLPSHHRVFWANGRRYYRCDGVTYKRVRGGYRVI